MENGSPDNERRRSQDDALVLRAVEDSSAFLLLYDIYYEKILRYILVRLRLKQISLDTANLVFIRASAGIRRFKGSTRRQFVQWLINIADIYIKDYFKKNPPQTIEPQELTEADLTHKEKLKSKILSVYATEKTPLTSYYIAASVIVFVLIIIFYSISSNKIDIREISQPVVKKVAPEPNKPVKIIRLMPVQKEVTPSESNEEDFEEIELISIGGIVKDTQSNPIQDASVKVLTDGLTRIFKTDANGLWLWEDFDPHDTNAVQILASHPGYVMPEKFRKPALDQLKNLTFETVLEKGISIRGRVVDWQQNPLPATVIKGPFPTTGTDIARCDANGNFKFPKAEEGIVILTVQCEHAAPAVIPIEVKPLMDEVLITLQPPASIMGQIVDINGIPVEDASVTVTSWQGVQSLSFSTKTDSQGYFRWDSAPPDQVFFNIAKKGFMSIHNYPMQGGIDYRVLMTNPFKIKGKIISGSPNIQIVNFIATTGYYFEKEKLVWDDANSVVFTGDKYELNITEPLEFKIKLQSEGFQTLESPVFTPISSSMNYDFVMHPEY